jgi:hypothetical protein
MEVSAVWRLCGRADDEAVVGVVEEEMEEPWVSDERRCGMYSVMLSKAVRPRIDEPPSDLLRVREALEDREAAAETEAPGRGGSRQLCWLLGRESVSLPPSEAARLRVPIEDVPSPSAWLVSPRCRRSCDNPFLASDPKLVRPRGVRVSSESLSP